MRNITICQDEILPVDNLEYKLINSYTYNDIPKSLLKNIHFRIQNTSTNHIINIYQDLKTLTYKLILIDTKFNKKSYIYLEDLSTFSIHRFDAPAVITNIFDLSTVLYYEHGLCHCLNGPQRTAFKKGVKISETYMVNNMQHRINGPSFIVFNPYNTKIKIMEHFKQYDKFHRLDDPAEIRYDLSNNTQEKINSESWYNNGKLHRLNGPAQIYYKTNAIDWFVNGKQIDIKKLPVFYNGQLLNKKLNKQSILNAMLFDREYGMFLKEKYEELSSANK